MVAQDELAKTVVREPAAESPAEYTHRVYFLAVTYGVLFTASVAGMALLAWQGRFFVTLTQRSNVETLVLAFFFIFFAYMALVSRPGAVGALFIAAYSAMALWIKDPRRREEIKQRAVSKPDARKIEVALNVLLEEDGRPGEPVELEVRDEAGRVGRLVIDGARLSFYSDVKNVSNNVFSFLERQVVHLLQDRGEPRVIDILAWKTINDEAAETYLSTVTFARNLERALGAQELWPKVILTAPEFQRLRAVFSEICHALRNEAFLPDWEYSAEHKLPIIPEPLGFATLSRSENRADPVATMGLAMAVVLGAIGILTLLIIFPPWVPGV